MKVTLKQPHEHGGVEYQAGETVELPDDAAAWLMAQPFMQDDADQTSNAGKMVTGKTTGDE